MNKSILIQAVGIETSAQTLSKRGDAPFVLATALLANVLRDADYFEIEAMANGDENAMNAFLQGLELGEFVREHTLDTFQDVARLELEERDEGSKSAFDVEMEIRQLQGVV